MERSYDRCIHREVCSRVNSCEECSHFKPNETTVQDIYDSLNHEQKITVGHIVSFAVHDAYNEGYDDAKADRKRKV